MKLKNLIEQRLDEKKEAIATSSNTNMTLHYDSEFKHVGEEGSPEFTFTISVSSTGGKEFYRGVSDSEESAKLTEATRLEFRRAMRLFDKQIQHIIQKYRLQIR
jgi:hypothetical protein